MMQQLPIFLQLLRRDVRVMLQQVVQIWIEAVILVCCFYLLYCHFMPRMGLTVGLIPAIFVGMMVSSALTMLFAAIQQVALDLDRQRVIDYYRTLPISLQVLALRYLVGIAVSVFLCILPMGFVGALVFKNFVDFSQGSLLLILFMLFLLLLVIAAISLSVVFFVPYVWFRDYMWTLCLTPLLFFGCELVPWSAAMRVAPRLGMLFLCNPMTYGIEGLRRAATGDSQYLSLSVCVSALVIWCIVATWVFILIFKRRLRV